MLRLINPHFSVFSVLAILPLDPQNGEGWKLDKNRCANGTTEKQVARCIEETAYSINDILKISNETLKVKTFFESTFHALCHSVEISNTMLSNNLLSTLTFQNNISYYLMLKDSKLKFLALSSETMPHVKLKVDPNMGLMYVSLKVKRTFRTLLFLV